MTDEQMSARLHTAGERWRAAQPTNVADASPALELIDDPDPDDSTNFDHRPDADPRPGPGRRFALAASAAVVAAAIAIGGATLLRPSTHPPAAPHTTARPVGLRGTVWKLVGYDSARRDLQSSASLYIGAQSNTLVADDACTLVGAAVGTGPSSITFSGRTVRHRACTGRSGARLSDGLAILLGRASYRIAGSELMISRAGHTMHLVPAPDATPVPTLDVPTVVGASWVLVSATDATGRLLQIYKFPRLKIGDNGRLDTGDQCNTITGYAVESGSRLVFSHVVSTRYACPSYVSGVVGVVAGVLTGTAQTSVVGGRLTIGKPGAGSLTYRWEPSNQSATEPARLTGRAWHLALFHGARPAGTATLTFTVKGSVAGRDGCSAVDGRYETGFGTLTLHIRATSPAGCPRATRPQAMMIDTYLSVPDLMWSVRDGRLIIDDGGAQADALVFTTAPVTTLAGQLWTWAGSQSTASGRPVGGSGSSSGPVFIGDPVLTFDGRGGWQLTGRCGPEVGSVVPMGSSTLRFSDRHTSPRRCPVQSPTEQQIYATIDRVLDGTTTWSIADDRLTLSRAGVTVTFHA